MKYNENILQRNFVEHHISYNLVYKAGKYWGKFPYLNQNIDYTELTLNPGTG